MHASRHTHTLHFSEYRQCFIGVSVWAQIDGLYIINRGDQKHTNYYVQAEVCSMSDE